jgi:hypothetical protein
MVACQVKVKGRRPLDSNFNSTTSAMTGNSSNQLTSIEKNRRYPPLSSNNQLEKSIRHSQTSINNLHHPVTLPLPEGEVRCLHKECHLLRTKRLKMYTVTLNRRMLPNILTLRRRRRKSLSYLKSSKESRDLKGSLNSSRDNRIVIRITIWCSRLVRE